MPENQLYVDANLDLAAKLAAAADVIVVGPSLNRTKTGGYDIKPGERILLVEKETDDPAVTAALVEAIHKVGARVDVFHVDLEDRPVEVDDEFRGMMFNLDNVEDDEMFELWMRNLKFLEKLAEEQRYALLIQGKAGALPRLDGVRYEGAPWYHRSVFPAAGFPWPLWDLVNTKAWAPIWDKGRGAEVHLTDPEGTDLRFTLPAKHWEAEYYEQALARRRFNEQYYLGHLYGYPTPPYDEEPDVNGVVAGTLNHFGPPFPHCTMELRNGRMVSLEGGGEYGDKWRAIEEQTKDIQYPEFPGPGLFWFWECAIGTHPKMGRPPAAFTLSGHAAVFERLRSGYIHIGVGTATGNAAEDWAEEQGLPYGHLHLHLQLPTYTMRTVDGEEIDIIKDGHLTALDDPDVRELAAEYGDPDIVLAESWHPPVPGVNVEGDYWKDYAHDPWAWFQEYDRQQLGQ